MNSAGGVNRVASLPQNDVYALLCFEGYVVRTATLADQQRPRWQYDDARAAVFPVTSVFSTLSVALFDTGNLVADDSLGPSPDSTPRSDAPQLGGAWFVPFRALSSLRLVRPGSFHLRASQAASRSSCARCVPPPSTLCGRA